MKHSRVLLACWGLACVAAPLGAHALLLRPALEEERRLMERAAQAPPAQPGALPRDADAPAFAERARALTEALRRRTLLAHDEAALLRAVTEAASRHGVVLDSLARSDAARSAPSPPPSTAGPGGPDPAAGPSHHRAAYALRVLGPYAGVAALLDDIQRLGGYVVFRSVRLAPDPQPESPWVEASIIAELVAPARPLAASHTPKESGDATPR